VVGFSGLRMAGSGVVAVATAVAPTNIAVVKYWGKRDAKLNLPINSSLSVTLEMDDMRTITSVAASEDFKSDRVWLNGVEEKVAGNKRMEAVFSEMRARAGDRVDPETGKVTVEKSAWANLGIHVVSENSFPTAAGLASSASGFACLTKALALLMNVSGELSDVARMGSGSASRSLFGGYAKWNMGELEDGSDSVAEQVASEGHWDDMHALICVVSDHKKTTSSTGGMIDSVRTSPFLAYRAEHIVPARMKDMEAAIKAKDFASFAELTMKDSNSFHSTCLDTFPPIKYMNDTSHAVVQIVHQINAAAGSAICAYTFDAGPNAVVFVLKEHVSKVREELLKHFGPLDESSTEPFVRGQTTLSAGEVLSQQPLEDGQAGRGGVRYIIHTKVGPGACENASLCLLDQTTGLPLKTSA